MSTRVRHRKSSESRIVMVSIRESRLLSLLVLFIIDGYCFKEDRELLARDKEVACSLLIDIAVSN
jgi:hypothetical protein